MSHINGIPYVRKIYDNGGPQKRKSKKLQKKYGWREAPPSKVGAPPGWRD